MESLLELEIDIAMALVLFVVLIHAVYKLEMNKVIDRLFISIEVSTLLIIIFETINITVNRFQGRILVIVNKFVNLAEAFLMPILCILFCSITYRWIGKKVHKIMEVILIIPVAINTLLCILSYKHGFYVMIDSNNIRVRGPLFFLLVIICFSYLFYNFIFVICNRKSFLNYDKYVFMGICIIPIILGLIQIKYPQILITWNGAGILVTMGYIMILNRKSRIDSLTSAANRNYLNDYIKYKLKHHDVKVTVVNIDVDNFKFINDTYGHSAGDKVLRVFAKSLIYAFRNNGSVIRMGGDEFLVIVENDNDDDVKKKMRRVEERISAWGKRRGNVQFSFTYSVMSAFSNEQSFLNLINASDIAMYSGKGE